MKKIPMLEKFAAQSLVESDGELIFSKEKFAELIVRDVLDEVLQAMDNGMDVYDTVADKFGVEE
jgi:hypothetical protein